MHSWGSTPQSCGNALQGKCRAYGESKISSQAGFWRRRAALPEDDWRVLDQMRNVARLKFIRRTNGIGSS